MLLADFIAGSLPTWILLTLGLFAAWRVTKGGTVGAVQELSKANEVLEKRIHQLGAEVRDLRIENEGLKARTDFSQALAPVLESLATNTAASTQRQAAIMDAQAHHEERAQKRQDGILHVLNLIASKLGDDDNGD